MTAKQLVSGKHSRGLSSVRFNIFDTLVYDAPAADALRVCVCVWTKEAVDMLARAVMYNITRVCLCEGDSYRLVWIGFDGMLLLLLLLQTVLFAPRHCFVCIRCSRCVPHFRVNVKTVLVVMPFHHSLRFCV